MKKIFETERLLIREFNPEDWQRFYDMNASIEVMRLIGNGNIQTIEEEQSTFKNILANYQKRTDLGIWAVCRQDEEAMMGAASMTSLAGTVEIQLGYRLRKEHWGQGYATEIAKGLIAYGFIQLHLDRITATTNLNNYASIRVLEKAGLRFEKTDTYYNCPMHLFVINKKKEN